MKNEQALIENELLEKVKTKCLYWNREYSLLNNLTESDIEFPDHIFHYGFNKEIGEKDKNKFESDYKPLLELLTTAKHNDETKIPDFYCSNGLIEHFEVVATKEDKNNGGSEYMKKYGQVDSKLKKEINKNLNKECKMEVGEIFEIPEQSYKSFVNSFKMNWESHIKSLQNYKGNKNNVCFLIYNNTWGLKMEKVFNKKKYNNNIKTGALRERELANVEKFKHVMVGRCSEILEYIGNFKDVVHYVICVSDCDIEIIKTDQTEYIASILGEYKYKKLKVWRKIQYSLQNTKNKSNL